MKTDSTHLELAVRTASDTAAMLRQDFIFDSGVTSDDHKDIKTQADLRAQRMILDCLAGTQHPVLAEEGDHGESVIEGIQWVVDPLDGTLNFTRGFPMAAVSIALCDGIQPLFGVICNVYTGEVYSGVVGKGAYLNGLEIAVSKICSLDKAVLATGFPSGSSYETEFLLKRVLDIQRYKKVRMLGSASLMLAQVAAGRFDVYHESDIYWWDVAAGLALIKAAGGDFKLKQGSGPFQFDVCAFASTMGPAVARS